MAEECEHLMKDFFRAKRDTFLNEKK